MWEKMGALSGLGCFALTAVVVWMQIWPGPQIKARRSGVSSETNTSRPLPVFVGVLLALGFLMNGLALWAAWHPTEAPTVRAWESKLNNLESLSTTKRSVQMTEWCWTVRILSNVFFRTVRWFTRAPLLSFSPTTLGMEMMAQAR